MSVVGQPSHALSYQRMISSFVDHRNVWQDEYWCTVLLGDAVIGRRRFVADDLLPQPPMRLSWMATQDARAGGAAAEASGCYRKCSVPVCAPGRLIPAAPIDVVRAPSTGKPKAAEDKIFVACTARRLPYQHQRGWRVTTQDTLSRYWRRDQAPGPAAVTARNQVGAGSVHHKHGVGRAAGWCPPFPPGVTPAYLVDARHRRSSVLPAMPWRPAVDRLRSRRARFVLSFPQPHRPSTGVVGNLDPLAERRALSHRQGVAHHRP
jgi:hypothetical protein